MELSEIKTIDLLKEITRRNNPEELFLYDFWEVLNDYFFDGQLKPCMVYQAVTPYGKQFSYGFSREYLEKREIVIQRNLSKKIILYQLLHELCHQWQYENLGMRIDRSKPHYDITWCLTVNKVLNKVKSNYTALCYRRVKTYEGENKYLIDDKFTIETGRKQVLTKDELANFPFFNFSPISQELEPIFKLPEAITHVLN